MPTVARSIGVTPEMICGNLEGPNEWFDVIVQNLSANNVCVLSDGSGDMASGLKIIANGNYTNDHRGEAVWLIADGAASDVRIEYVKFIDSDRMRV